MLAIEFRYLWVRQVQGASGDSCAMKAGSADENLVGVGRLIGWS